MKSLRPWALLFLRFQLLPAPVGGPPGAADNVRQPFLAGRSYPQDQDRFHCRLAELDARDLKAGRCECCQAAIPGRWDA